LARKPLGLQKIAPDDSVLGLLRDPAGLGLARSYADLIQQAFDPSTGPPPRRGTDSRRWSRTFSLFWGLAIMLYEDTLLSDDAPIDHFLDGDASALTPQQRFGKALFEGQAQCVNCHHGAIMSGAAFDLASVLSEEITEVTRSSGCRWATASSRSTTTGSTTSASVHRRGSRRGRQGSIRQSALVCA